MAGTMIDQMYDDMMDFFNSIDPHNVMSYEWKWRRWLA